MAVDKELQSLIETTLFNDPRLSSHPISVVAQDAKVTLSGVVQSYRRKLLAQQIVGSFDGVDEVVNELTVEPTASSPDDNIAADVRAALDANADVTKSTVQVSVLGGKVTLQGTVGSLWEQAVADDIARGVRGVRDVVNLLIVNIETKIGDEELANSIKAAWSRARGLTDTDLGVALAGNAATLSGRVQHQWQREIAEMVVRQFGLLHVHNAIEVVC